MRRLSNDLIRTVVVESTYLDRPKPVLLCESLRKAMVREAVEHAVGRDVKSLAKLRKALHKSIHEKHPDMPTGLMKTL